MKKLSIILTVYNKEQYLRRILNCLMTQNNINQEEYEIVAVNDGSTDNSYSILLEYSKRSQNMIILNQNNQGLSLARNNGLNVANGEYVWFVDADDIISSNSVHLILETIKYRPDVIPIYARFKGDEKIHNSIKTSAETGKDVLIDNWSHCGVFWVLRKDFLTENNLEFFPGIYHEDSEFTPRMLYVAKTVKVIPEVLYFVDCDPTSITQVPRPKRAFDCLIVAEHLYDFIEDNRLKSTQVGTSLYYNVSMTINNGLDIIVLNSANEQNEFNNQLYNKKKLINALKLSPNLKHQIEGVLFSCFPNYYVELYKLLRLFKSLVSR